MNLDHEIVGVAFAVVGYFVLRTLRDMKGLSRKINRILAFLIRTDDMNPEQRRRELSHILEGK